MNDELMSRKLAALFADCVSDVEEIEWALNTSTFGDPKVVGRGRDGDVPFRTNTPQIIADCLKLRAAAVDAGSYDEMVSPDEIVAALNTPGSFGVGLVQPEDPNAYDPCWTPQFVLFVRDEATVVELSRPTWDQLGRFAWRAIEDPLPAE